MAETVISGTLPPSPLRILLADDFGMVREAVKDLLAGRPDDWFVCGESANGLDVLEKVRELKPDVVLLDLSVPGKSGVEVAKILEKEYPGSTIILMSAQDPAMLKRIASMARVELFVSKSSLAMELVPLLERISHRRHSGPQALAASPRV